MSSQADGSERLLKIISWTVIILMVVLVISAALSSAALLILLAIKGFSDQQHGELYFAIFQDHLRVIVGLPIAALASLLVILVLRSTHGPIEFESPRLKFKGASGPIVLWLLCFLGIVIAVRFLW